MAATKIPWVHLTARLLACILLILSFLANLMRIKRLYVLFLELS